MKNIIPTMVALGTLAFMGSSCDLVDMPIDPANVAPVDSTLNFPALDTANVNLSTRKVLVEEFTGHKCPNCPLNTKKLLRKQENNEPEIVVISYHEGAFATVEEPPFDTDYQTDFGNELLTEYGIISWPTALVNRAAFNIDGSNQNTFTAHDFWVVPIDISLENNESAIAVGIAADYVADSNMYLISVGVNALVDLETEHRLSLLFLEDSTISAQVDITIPFSEDPKQTNLEYVHNHIFRDVVNADFGLSGDVIVPSSGLAKDEWIGVERTFEVPDYITDPLNVSFVAVIIESATSEVIQVEQVHAQEPTEQEN